MRLVIGAWLVAVALLYFYTFFEVDYGVSLDEVIGGVALLVGMLLLFCGWLEAEADRHLQEREEAWKDGRP